MAVLKAMGSRAGVSDLVFLLGHPPWRGVIELKTPSGRLSPAQALFRDECFTFGVPYEVARSIEAVFTILTSWGVDLLREPVGLATARGEESAPTEG
jgi:hypothetical protein